MHPFDERGFILLQADQAMTQKKILITVSAIVLLALIPITVAGSKLAGISKSHMQGLKDPQSTAQKIGNEPEAGAKTAASAVGNAIEETYYDLKHAFSQEQEEKQVPPRMVTVKTSTTASGMIGKNVLDAKGDTIATVEDIILSSSDGKATLVIVRDSGFFGLGGKLVALDYGRMTSHDRSGDVIMPVAEKFLDKFLEFTYDRTDKRPDVRVIPTDGLSVQRILDGHIQNNDGQNIADIDNITFLNGVSQYLVISFNEILLMGGNRAILEYKDLEPSQQDGALNFMMTAKQSVEFENYRKNMKKNEG